MRNFAVAQGSICKDVGDISLARSVLFGSVDGFKEFRDVYESWFFLLSFETEDQLFLFDAGIFLSPQETASLHLV